MTLSYWWGTIRPYNPSLYHLFLAIRMIFGLEGLLLKRAFAALAQLLERSTFFTNYNLLPYHFVTSQKKEGYG
jgi:hypothetical protein